METTKKNNKMEEFREIVVRGTIINVGNNGTIYIGGRKRNQTKNNNYLQVNFNCDREYTHRLVGFAFVNNPFNFDCIDHVDGNEGNNHFTNLRWCTRGRNVQYGYNNMPIQRSNRMKDAWSKVVDREDRLKNMRAASSNKVRCIENGEVFDSMAAAGMYIGVSRSMIWSIIKEKKSCRGFSFERMVPKSLAKPKHKDMDGMSEDQIISDMEKSYKNYFTHKSMAVRYGIGTNTVSRLIKSQGWKR